MDVEVIGGGLAVFAFWAFIASCVVGGIWRSVREKETRHETLRRIIESGKDVDAELIDRIMSDDNKGDNESEVDLKVGAYITMSAAPGLALLGWVLEIVSDNDKVFPLLLAIAGLVFFIAIGLLVASRVVKRSREPGDDRPLV